MSTIRDGVSEAAWALAAEALEHEAMQKEAELAGLLDLVAERPPGCVVEIGTARGGSFYAWCRLARPDALLVSVDLPDGPFGGGYTDEDVARFRTWAQPGQTLEFIRADSHDPATVERVREVLNGRQVDLLFVDGDHTYYGARKDFELYAPLVAQDGLIAFHDVLPHPQMPECKVDVLWREVREGYDHREFLEPGHDRGWGPWGGIGVLFAASRNGGRRAVPVRKSSLAALEADVERERQRAGELERELAAARTYGERRRRERDEARGAIAKAAAAAEKPHRERFEELERYVIVEHATRGWKALDAYRRAVNSYRHRGPVAPRQALRRAVAVTASLPERAQEARSTRYVGAAGRDIVFRRPDRPRVSIVIPAFNNVAVTLACLRSLVRNTPHDLIEVIVVDDVSTDGTPEALEQATGLTVVHNDHNLGFLQTCNRGAAEASGEYVFFLNNDVEVEPGWLEPLLDAAGSAPDVGAVGSKLVYPDGTLQEAGSFIWSDGRGWNFGKDADDPEAPEFSYRREVDYCSGAALLVRRDLWERIGGFDVRYAPIYYEETDLCFAIRAEGFRVLYEPRSVVVHHEGMTHGTERKAGVGGSRHTKTGQYRNQHVFAEKWSRELARQRPPGTASGYLGGRIDRRPRVLVADTWVPAHDRDSGSLRMTWILRLLRSLGCSVTLFTTDRNRREPYTAAFQREGVEVHYGPESFAAFAARRTGHYDLVLLSRPYVAQPLLDDVGRHFPLATIAYDMIDAHFLREARKAEILGVGAALDADALKADELDCIRRSDFTIAVTEDEAALVRREEPTALVRVLPNVHELEPGPFPSFDERAGLLFIGGFRHDPNIDAVKHIVNDVMPLVRERLGDVPLTIAGSHPPPSVAALRAPEVAVTGWVPDVSDLFRRARVFIAPLRYGAGMKGKVGHAMAFGLPLVTTAIGAEGMDLEDGRHALVRDDAESFAEAVVRLYTDAELWSQLATTSREAVAERWTPDAMRARLSAVLEEAVGLRLAALRASAGQSAPAS
jgi:GT2 family glycosyltransferase/predicted O-methyltransferase YrrM